MSMKIWNEMEISVSDHFLNPPFPEEYVSWSQQERLEYVEEHLKEGLGNLDPETVLETIENIAGDAIFTMRRAAT